MQWHARIPGKHSIESKKKVGNNKKKRYPPILFFCRNPVLNNNNNNNKNNILRGDLQSPEGGFCKFLKAVNAGETGRISQRVILVYSSTCWLVALNIEASARSNLQLKVYDGKEDALNSTLYSFLKIVLKRMKRVRPLL